MINRMGVKKKNFTIKTMIDDQLSREERFERSLASKDKNKVTEFERTNYDMITKTARDIFEGKIDVNEVDPKITATKLYHNYYESLIRSSMIEKGKAFAQAGGELKDAPLEYQNNAIFVSTYQSELTNIRLANMVNDSKKKR